jgi:hypothetical protein
MKLNVNAQRRGYALLWVIMMVAVIAALAASVTTQLGTNTVDKRAVDSTAQMLREIGVGLNAMEQSVARKFPGRPSELTNPLTSVGGYRIMSCWNNSYNNPDSTNWAGAAPFVTFYIPTTGLWTPLGRLRDSIENRNGATGTAFLWLNLRGVPLELAQMLDVAVDGKIGNATDTVQYTIPANTGDTTTVRFRVTPREFNRC